MIRDSIKDGMTDGENYELLSFRKIYHIISHPDFKKLVEALSKLGSDKHKILDQTTVEDADGIMEVIRSLPFEEGTGQHDDKSSPRIARFIREVTQHIEDINKDQTRGYHTAKDLVIDILTGKNSERITKENLKKVIEQLKEKTKAITESVPVESSKVESAKAVLEMLETILKVRETQVQA